MKRQVVLCFLCIWSTSSATTLALIRTPQGVFVAADSYRIEQGKGSVFCKIVQVNNSFIAFSGTPDIDVRENNKPRPDLSFHGFAIAKQAAHTQGTMIAKANSFVRLALDPFKHSVAVIKENAPQQYRAQFLGYPQALEVVFFGMNPDQIPAFDVVDFGVSEDAKGRIVVSPSFMACPSPTCSDSAIKLSILGVNEKAIVASKDPHFFTGDGATDVQRLVEIEAADRPDAVKAPIDVMQVTALGATWIHRKRQCKDVEPYTPSP